jgi:two-component system response regulator DevR
LRAHQGGPLSGDPWRPEPEQEELLRAISEAQPIRLFLVDDHEVVRRGIRDLVEIEPDMEVVGEAATAADALTGVRDTEPDVAVLDVRLPDGDGVEVCREIRARHPRTQCLILTSYPDEEALLNALIAGAAGYLLKLASGEELTDAIRTVAKGRSLLDPQATRSAVDEATKGSGAATDPLSSEEKEIFEFVVDGLTNKQVAERIGTDEETVRVHIWRILAKLGLRSRSEAMRYPERLQGGQEGKEQEKGNGG